MKVNELIAHLQKMPQDLKVICHTTVDDREFDIIECIKMKAVNKRTDEEYNYIKIRTNLL